MDAASRRGSLLSKPNMVSQDKGGFDKSLAKISSSRNGIGPAKRGRI
jgi:hypothetical protein